MPMTLNSCYSPLRLILKAVISTYSNAYHLSEAGFYTMALLSTQTRLTLRALEPPTHRRQSLSSLTSIQVADASVSLSEHIKLLGTTLDKRSTFDLLKRLLNTYFYIRALRHIRTFLDLESSKSIAWCAIVSSRFDYANTCLSGVSSYNIHRLQRLALSISPTLLLCCARYSSPFTAGCLSVSE